MGRQSLPKSMKTKAASYQQQCIFSGESLEPQVLQHHLRSYLVIRSSTAGSVSFSPVSASSEVVGVPELGELKEFLVAVSGRKFSTGKYGLPGWRALRMTALLTPTLKLSQSSRCLSLASLRSWGVKGPRRGSSKLGPLPRPVGSNYKLLNATK